MKTLSAVTDFERLDGAARLYWAVEVASVVVVAMEEGDAVGIGSGRGDMGASG